MSPGRRKSSRATNHIVVERANSWSHTALTAGLVFTVLYTILNSTAVLQMINFDDFPPSPIAKNIFTNNERVQAMLEEEKTAALQNRLIEEITAEMAPLVSAPQSTLDIDSPSGDIIVDDDIEKETPVGKRKILHGTEVDILDLVQRAKEAYENGLNKEVTGNNAVTIEKNPEKDTMQAHDLGQEAWAKTPQVESGRGLPQWPAQTITGRVNPVVKKSVATQHGPLSMKTEEHKHKGTNLILKAPPVNKHIANNLRSEVMQIPVAGHQNQPGPSNQYTFRQGDLPKSNRIHQPEPTERSPTVEKTRPVFNEHLQKPFIDYNPEFIFHTKLPKAGSSTMNNLLNVMSAKNRFYYFKLNPHFDPEDNFASPTAVLRWAKGTLRARTDPTMPVVLLKHHYPFNFSDHGMSEPTYINVIREPASWFQSHYYFERNGWKHSSESRNSFKGSDADRRMTINECVQSQHADCVSPKWNYLAYIGGAGCKAKGKKQRPIQKVLAEKAQHVAQAKRVLFTQFYSVGVLEEFELTLRLFEAMMPRVFKGALEVLHSPKVKAAIAKTKSLNVTKITEHNAELLRKGPLRYECDLYAYGKAVFMNQVLQHRLL